MAAGLACERTLVSYKLLTVAARSRQLLSVSITIGDDAPRRKQAQAPTAPRLARTSRPRTRTHA